MTPASPSLRSAAPAPRKHELTCNSQDVLARYASYGWHTQHVKNGDTDLDGIAAAIKNAQNEKDRPSIIKVTTTIGFGSAHAGTGKVHGEPLKKDDLANVKKKWGFDPAQNFAVPEDVKAAFNQVQLCACVCGVCAVCACVCTCAVYCVCINQRADTRQTKRGLAYENEWQATWAKYERSFPELAAEFKRRLRSAHSQHAHAHPHMTRTHTPILHARMRTLRLRAGC